MSRTRNVTARDYKMKPAPWNLTSAQWSVYYWLLAHSYWNSFEKESHYYIYKNSYKQVRIMEDTGIKSRATMSTAFKRLEEVGAIAPSPQHEDAYEIYTTSIFVPMDISILKCLLGFYKWLDPSLLITTFAILSRLARFIDEQEISLTKAELGALLGLARQNVDGQGIVLILSVLEHLGLITLKRSNYTNKLGQECIKYTLLAARPNADLSCYLTNDDAPDAARIQELWNMVAEN